jgi:hypothetical protein
MQALDEQYAKLTNERTIPAKGKAGRIVRSARLFGAELELTRGGETIRKHINLAGGLNLKRDGSVNGEALELTTPPLSGTSAEYVFNNVLTKALRDSKTDTTCGLHVHVDARDFQRQVQKDNVRAFLRLTATYLALQAFMFSIVPHSRRSNNYTKRIEGNVRTFLRLRDALASGDEATQKSAYWHVQRDVCGDDRYQWYNLVPWYREGHYEVRLHGGTHDTRKVLEWANLHTLLADSAMHKWIPDAELYEIANGAGNLRVLEILTERLRLTSASTTYWRGRISRFNA